jgi:hypothetical protein
MPRSFGSDAVFGVKNASLAIFPDFTRERDKLLDTYTKDG